jgi:hypothetical protein
MLNLSPELLDPLLQDYQGPQDLIGDNGILQQLTKALVERCMSGEIDPQLREAASEVRIHPYGNDKITPYRSGNNAHIHKEDDLKNQLNDRGIPSTDPSATHIGIPNPQNLPLVRNRPHGAPLPK